MYLAWPAAILKFFAHLVTDEPFDHDVFTGFVDFFSNQFFDGQFVVLEKVLVQQADIGVELAQFAFDDLLDDVGRLAAAFQLLAIDFFFLFQDGGRDVLFGDEARDSWPRSAWRCP